MNSPFDLPLAQRAIAALAQRLIDRYDEFSPLEFLLAANRLSYDDYRAWQTGASPNLDGALDEGVEEFLLAGREYAAKVGLTEHTVQPIGDGAAAGKRLVASRITRLDSLLRGVFTRVAPEGQLDLFLDGKSVHAQNDLRETLLAGDAKEAKRAFARLKSLDGSHRWLHHAAALIAAIEMPLPRNADDGLAIVARLDGEWTAAGGNIFGARLHDFLVPLWRAAGRAIATVNFDPANPDRHASYAYMQSFDWRDAERCVREVTDYRTQPSLLARLAEAVWRQRRRVEAVDHWFALCWSAPDEFHRLIEDASFPDWMLFEGWRLGRDEDLEPEITAPWFPAWMVLCEPGLARAITAPVSADAPQLAFRTLAALTAGDGADIELRRRLQHLHPGLLASFLSRR